MPRLLNISVILISGATLADALARANPWANTCLAVSAIALWLIQSSQESKARRVIGRVLSATVLLTGAANLAAAVLRSGPIMMVPISALDFLLLGSALLSYRDIPRHTHPTSHLLAFVVALIATLPLIGHLYGAGFVTGVGLLSGMAPQTAFCFILLSVSILLGRLDHDLAAVLVSDGPGGFMARRLLPAAILFPFVLGLAKVIGVRAGLFSEELGTAFVATINIAGFAAFIWFQGLALQRGEGIRRSIQRDRDTLAIQNSLRDQFISMISHDLRTPLTAANTYAQMIRRFPENRSLTVSHADKIVACLSRSDAMIRDLLDVNRIRAGHALPVSMVECELGLIARATVHELSAISGDRFRIEAPDEIKGFWDPLAIRRAMENLCGNALKYGSPDSMITVRLGQSSGRVKIAVHNQGPPIPEAEQEKLFVAFQRASTADPSARKGWGIGLALVRAIAEAHGGCVRLQSSRERGTTFTIDLPIESRKQISSREAS